MVHRRYRARASNLACVIPRMKGSVCFCGMTVLNAELKCACGDPPSTASHSAGPRQQYG